MKVFNNTKNCSIFKSFFSNLVQNLVSKLPLAPNVFTESKVASYYDDIKFKDLNFEFSETSPEKILNILKGLNPSKAAGIDNLSGKFLKDSADILARPIEMETEMEIFKSKQKKFKDDLKIKLCDKRLYCTEIVKYLSVKIDTNLSWEYHVNDLSFFFLS